MVKGSSILTETKKKMHSIITEDASLNLVEIARILGITHVAVSRHLKNLEKKTLLKFKLI